ncbi:hypothetical protein BB560_004277 [Smittium megazygosporum]|uniref:HMG box domain-containing protein n=1 Tax=Smittium megazygosporum TaxID=133381 RepID=A0A2T9Z9V3_9FUNG|nr:hypothetical protein BB560_004277 [Smittium megazygosporum]
MPKLTKRAHRKKKDQNAPKRGLSAYMFFSQEYREKVKLQNPDATFGKILGEMWKEMTDDQKKPYKAKAEKDKQRYEAEKASYQATLA